LAGDYVNLRFSNNNGFIIVSGPVGLYYVNVGTGCKNVDPKDEESDCRWFHTTEHGKYIVMGRSAVSVTAQIVAMEAGVFQVTIGFFDRDCCEWVEALAESDGVFRRDVSSHASACFIHTAITGTMEVTGVTLSSKALIRGYDYHSAAASITESQNGIVIADTEGIAALMLDNTDSASHYNFSFHVTVTDPDDTALNLGFLKDYNAEDLYDPTTLLGEGRGGSQKALSPGACVGIECTPNATTFAGNRDGVKSTADGDPIYEELSDSSMFIFIGALSLVMVLLVIGIAPVLLCYRRRRARERLASEEQELSNLTGAGETRNGLAVSDPYEMPKPNATPGDYIAGSEEEETQLSTMVAPPIFM
jgi:hypothetical protein